MKLISHRLPDNITVDTEHLGTNRFATILLYMTDLNEGKCIICFYSHDKAANMGGDSPDLILPRTLIVSLVSPVSKNKQQAKAAKPYSPRVGPPGPASGLNSKRPRRPCASPETSRASSRRIRGRSRWSSVVVPGCPYGLTRAEPYSFTRRIRTARQTKIACTGVAPL